MKYHKSGEEFRFRLEKAQQEDDDKTLMKISSMNPSDLLDLSEAEIERRLKILQNRLNELRGGETAQEEESLECVTQQEEDDTLEEIEKMDAIRRVKDGKMREELMQKGDATPQDTILRRQNEAEYQKKIEALEKSYGHEKAARLRRGFERAELIGSAGALSRAYEKALKTFPYPI
ncbi:MAG: hypothetical protein ABID38_05800 [Candidatus Diapherotrites archaeon]